MSRRHFVRGVTLAAVSTTGVHAGSSDPVRRRFLCCDYEGNRVAIVGSNGAVEWDFAIQTPQDCWQLRNRNVLVCYRHGAKEITPKKEVIWEYRAPEAAQCHSCQPLPGGGVLVAECGMSRLVEVGRDGTVSRVIPVASNAKNMGHQFRGTRKTPDGHYWACLMDEQKIVELSPSGSVLREIHVDGFPHEAIVLPKGNLLVTLGPAKRVIELDPKGAVVWQIGENELPGNPLRLPAGCQRLKNGNTIVCNYLPGPFVGKQPQAFEVTRDKKVVWELVDHAHFKTVNQIYVLDGSGGRVGRELR